jgi:exosome complex component RRP41
MSGNGSGKGLTIRRTDLLSLSNLRADGRKPHELRRIQIEMGVIPGSIGSAMFTIGLTSCIAIVSGPMECIRRSDEMVDRAVLDVSIQIAPYASTDRRVYYPNTDRRLIESTVQIQHALEAATLLQSYPKSRIAIHISVLTDDGGRICAAINAATLALIDAGIPMKDFCCACSAGGTSSDVSIDSNNIVLIDLNRNEESNHHNGTSSNSSVNIPVAILPQRNTIVYTQCTDARLPNLTSMEFILEAAMEGCRAIYELMQQAVQDHASSLLESYQGQPKNYHMMST